MMRLRAAIASIPLILLAAAGHAQKQGGVLRVYHNDNPPTASLHEEVTIGTLNPFMAVFNNLVIFDQTVKRNAEDTIMADLAESWSWSADNTKLTFTLRRGVKWHDGTGPIGPSPRTCRSIAVPNSWHDLSATASWRPPLSALS